MDDFFFDDGDVYKRQVVARPAEGGGALSLREVEDALLREFAR